MTAPNPDSETRINAFYDRHGAAWGVIEYSGQDREKHTGSLYASEADAQRERRQSYGESEIDEMDVAIARWDREGEFWTYDY